jgi:hypothetical protein
MRNLQIKIFFLEGARRDLSENVLFSINRLFDFLADFLEFAEIRNFDMTCPPHFLTL